MRTLIDKICRLGIKLCMLTGVAFTMAACYGPPPSRYLENEPDFPESQQKIEEQINETASEVSTVAGESEEK